MLRGLLLTLDLVFFQFAVSPPSSQLIINNIWSFVDVFRSNYVITSIKWQDRPDRSNL